MNDKLIRKMVSDQKYGVSMPASSDGKFAFCSKDFNTTNLNISNDPDGINFENMRTFLYNSKDNFWQLEFWLLSKTDLLLIK